MEITLFETNANAKERLRSELAEIVKRRNEAAENLAVIERQIYAYEGSYLEDTSVQGNIVQGWEKFLSTFSSTSREDRPKFMSTKSRAKKKVRDTDRLFSNSSISSTSAVCSVWAGSGGSSPFSNGNGQATPSILASPSTSATSSILAIPSTLATPSTSASSLLIQLGKKTLPTVPRLKPLQGFKRIKIKEEPVTPPESDVDMDKEGFYHDLADYDYQPGAEDTNANMTNFEQAGQSRKKNKKKRRNETNDPLRKNDYSIQN